MSTRSTKKNKAAESDTLRPSYKREDLGKGVRGKYFADFQAGTNLVLLAPDVAEIFATPRAVNDALRSLIVVAERSTRGTTQSGKTRKLSAAPKHISDQISQTPEPAKRSSMAGAGDRSGNDIG